MRRPCAHHGHRRGWGQGDAAGLSVADPGGTLSDEVGGRTDLNCKQRKQGKRGRRGGRRSTVLYASYRWERSRRSRQRPRVRDGSWASLSHVFVSQNSQRLLDIGPQGGGQACGERDGRAIGRGGRATRDGETGSRERSACALGAHLWGASGEAALGLAQLLPPLRAGMRPGA